MNKKPITFTRVDFFCFVALAQQCIERSKYAKDLKHMLKKHNELRARLANGEMKDKFGNQMPPTNVMPQLV